MFLCLFLSSPPHIPELAVANLQHQPALFCPRLLALCICFLHLLLLVQESSRTRVTAVPVYTRKIVWLQFTVPLIWKSPVDVTWKMVSFWALYLYPHVFGSSCRGSLVILWLTLAAYDPSYHTSNSRVDILVVCRFLGPAELWYCWVWGLE